MKTIEKKAKAFDTVKTFRVIKEEIANEIKDMNFEQLEKYLERTRLQSITPVAK